MQSVATVGLLLGLNLNQKIRLSQTVGPWNSEIYIFSFSILHFFHFRANKKKRKMNCERDMKWYSKFFENFYIIHLNKGFETGWIKNEWCWKKIIINDNYWTSDGLNKRMHLLQIDWDAVDVIWSFNPTIKTLSTINRSMIIRVK